MEDFNIYIEKGGIIFSILLLFSAVGITLIFYKMFEGNPNTAINFLSNKSNLYEDLSIISKMPKWIFLKQLF